MTFRIPTLDIRMRKFYRLAFPLIMVAIMAATFLRYEAVRNFRERSSEHRFEVEVKDLDSVVKAIKEATSQPVHVENLSGDRYRIVVRCPSDSVGTVVGIMQRLGCKRHE